MKHLQLLVIGAALASLPGAGLCSQPIPHLSPRQQLIVDGRPFIMLAGELHNSSASSLAYMEPRWDRLVAMNLNTVLAPVSWEMIEPREGEFDFSNLDGLVAKAREKRLRLVILWFGTWKNACSSYAPEWVRRDLKRFFRSEVEGRKINHISALCEAAGEADARAFARLMKHIKAIDGETNTIISVQVQNEVGLRYGAFGADIRWMPRDTSAAANAAFGEQVPDALMEFLAANRQRLTREFLRIWERSGFRARGTWTEVFLADAGEVFMAWHTARYVEKVAAAGKAEHPLPLFVNVWLSFDENLDREVSNTYPSGSSVIKMLPVWKAAAPSIDIIAPDIYRKAPDFVRICRQYQQMDNPLLIPETRGDRLTSSALFAYGSGALGYSPFGIDGNRSSNDEIRDCYRFVGQFVPYLNQYHGTGRMLGFWGETGVEEIELGDYLVRFTYETPAGSTADQSGNGGIIIALSGDEFLVAGYGTGFSVRFAPKPGMPAIAEILWAYEMVCEEGVWKRQRRLNGDQTGRGTNHHTALLFASGEIAVWQVKVFCYE